MKLAIISTALLMSVSAVANAASSKITCVFTEPFFSMEYDLVAKTATWSGPDEENDPAEEVTKVLATDIDVHVDMTEILLPKYQITDNKGQALAYLKMDFAGSNGMAETVYPLSVEVPGSAVGTTDNQSGGCYTEDLNPVEPEVHTED